MRTATFTCLLICFALALGGRAQEVQAIGPGLRKLAGLEPTQKIAYARIFLDGIPVLPNSLPKAEPLLIEAPPPVLIAQCTKSASGKFRFELMMNFGGIKDITYHPPWKSTGLDDPYAPSVQKTAMIFDFFGYTKVKPVKRNWEVVLDPYGEYRYDPPGSGSRNLEEITFYLQYLKALPTLRLTHGSTAVQFETTPLLLAVRNEPLCWASGV